MGTKTDGEHENTDEGRKGTATDSGRARRWKDPPHHRHADFRRIENLKNGLLCFLGMCAGMLHTCGSSQSWLFGRKENCDLQGEPAP